MTQYTAYLRGNNFRPAEAKAIFNNLTEGQTLVLLRESANQYDPNAIMVLDPDTEIHLGYVAKEIAADGLADELDSGKEHRCVVETVMFPAVILAIETID